MIMSKVLCAKKQGKKMLVNREEIERTDARKPFFSSQLTIGRELGSSRLSFGCWRMPLIYEITGSKMKSFTVSRLFHENNEGSA